MQGLPPVGIDDNKLHIISDEKLSVGGYKTGAMNWITGDTTDVLSMKSVACLCLFQVDKTHAPVRCCIW